jgi:arsenate reductase
MVPPDDIKPGYRGNRPRMGGRGVLTPRTPAAAQPAKPSPSASVKKRVLFVCIGNSCRSQMAEAFARAYGSDVMVVESAGVAPAIDIAPLTKQMLAERNLNIEGHFPKGLEIVGREPFDVVVNMSGQPVSLPNAWVLTWPVRDPIGLPESVYRSVVQQIEGLVMGLILSLRSGRGPG